MENPHYNHWKVAKRILRYIKGAFKLVVEYKDEGEPTLVGYTDSINAGYIDDKKSTLGDIFHLGSGPISWSSKKQSTCHFHQQRKNILAYQRHLKKLYGSEDYFKKHIINKLVQPPYSKTTKAPSSLQRILYTVPGPNTLKFIITSFMT